MSWSEVLPNIQLEEALHFVAPATRIKETTKNAHRYSTPKRPIGVFPIKNFHSGKTLKNLNEELKVTSAQKLNLSIFASQTFLISLQNLYK